MTFHPDTLCPFCGLGCGDNGGGPHYGVTPRSVLTVLGRAVCELGPPHPLHVHGCNLGPHHFHLPEVMGKVMT